MNAYHIKKSMLFLILVSLYAAPAMVCMGGTIVSISAVGDMRFNDYIGDRIRQEGFDYPFGSVADALGDTDITYGNLECCLCATGAEIKKKYRFRADPIMVNALVRAGFDVVDVANNHSGDYGAEAFTAMLGTLTDNNIRFTGGGMNIHESRKPVVISTHGLVVSMLSYSNTLPDDFWATEEKPGVTPAYLSYISADVAEAKKHSDMVVVGYHGGDERSPVPKQSQRDIAYTAINAGASLVLGHHPHVLQGIEVYRGVPIIYSLGNFMFLSLAKQCYDTMIVRAFLSKAGVETLEIVPVRIGDACVVPADYTQSASILRTIQGLSADMNTDIVIKNNKGYVIIP
ncbi:MAG: CapA family protein [Elusimicrobia bacterium]|nr:CapA family protein [Elusimicrobiota bacterium]